MIVWRVLTMSEIYTRVCRFVCCAFFQKGSWLCWNIGKKDQYFVRFYLKSQWKKENFVQKVYVGIHIKLFKCHSLPQEKVSVFL